MVVAREATRAAGVRKGHAETMLVRIRFGKALRVGRARRRNKRVALAVSALLTPGAFLASVLALWRIAADLNFTAKFAIASGVFSHWQVWMVVAVLLQVCSHMLARYGKRDDGKGSTAA
ncbi:MAG: hypothetical protein ABSH00_14740 [Bryobacteraceae bacterium]